MRARIGGILPAETRVCIKFCEFLLQEMISKFPGPLLTHIDVTGYLTHILQIRQIQRPDIVLV